MKCKIRSLLTLLMVLSLLFSNAYAQGSFQSQKLQNGSFSDLDIIDHPILKNMYLGNFSSEILKSNEELQLNLSKLDNGFIDSSKNLQSKLFSKTQNNSNESLTTSGTMYTPFINYLDQQFSNMPSTPNNESVTTVFSKIRQNNPDIEYLSNYAIDSAYVLSTTINNIRQDFYVMEIVYPVSLYPGSPVTEDHGLIIYNQNYKSHPLYNTGRYKKGFTGIRYGNSGSSHDYLSIRAGTVNAYVPIKRYSHTEFGEYRKYYLYDFFNPSISIEMDCGYDSEGSRPYFVSWLTCGNRIIYGKAYSDGSGRSELYRIDRILGNQISNNNMLFSTIEEFESGTALTYDTYTFYSTIGDGKTYNIDLNTLQTN